MANVKSLRPEASLLAPVQPERHPALPLVVAGVALLLGACATPADIPAGTPLSDVQARYGRGTVQCPLPSGGQRVVWSGQPMGQYAWATNVTPEGRVGQIEQILTDASFAHVETGTWDVDRLLCTFGPPAERATVGLPGTRQLVWSYRYRQSGAWNSLMHFYLSPEGQVTRMHPGPDPLFEAREWPLP